MEATLEQPVKKAETRRFQMHSHLLLDVIQRQAGTLMKAILEGVMNSIDAGCRTCEITVNDCGVTIVDDGNGITKRKEISDWFESFGQPHDEEEKKRYGVFRMGRGQMFAFGHNVWRTGPFEMTIDVKKRGLDYELKTHKERHAGCRIEITLYDTLLPSDVAETVDVLTEWLKYAPGIVILNGKTVNRDPAVDAWDMTLPEAYVKLNATHNLSVYNLGVHTMDLGSYRLGTGGVIVSRRQLKVNFARNDIQSDCEVWKAIKTAVDARAQKEIVQKKSLNDGERARMAKVLKANPSLSGGKDLKLFTAVTGRHFSAKELARQSYKFHRKLTACLAGSPTGDSIHQRKIAFVLAKETLERFGLTIDELLALTKKVYLGGEFTTVPFEDVSSGIDESYELLDAKNYRASEVLWADLIERSAYELVRTQRGDWRAKERKVCLGVSAVTNGWTDGRTYIAVGRAFLEGLNPTVEGFVALGALLCHEYAHGEADTRSHPHDQTFYETYHELTRDKLPAFVNTCVLRLPKAMVAVGRKVKSGLREADKMAATRKELTKILETLEEPDDGTQNEPVR